VTLPTNAKARKDIPIFTGMLKYFPDAVAAVAKLSVIGNEQHNPGEPLHWARGKSTDQHDTLVRHVMEAGTLDADGVPHDVKVAWRALAALQEYLEENPWATTVNDILSHDMDTYKPGTASTDWTTFIEPVEHCAQYCVRFSAKRGPVTSVTYKGPFRDLAAADKYLDRNPEGITGLKTIHALNRP